MLLNVKATILFAGRSQILMLHGQKYHLKILTVRCQHTSKWKESKCSVDVCVYFAPNFSQHNVTLSLEIQYAAEVSIPLCNIT